MDDENFENVIELKHFKNEIDAEMLVKHLQLQRIFAFIKKDDPAAMGLIRGASVMVRKEDRQKALDLLKDLNVD